MTRTRTIGLIGVLLGIAMVIYSLSRSTTIGAGGASGTGVISPLQICPGVLLIIAGLTVLALGKQKLR